MSDRIASVVTTVRYVGRVPLALRVVSALSALVAVLATVTPSWNAGDGYIAIAALFAIAGSLVPDSGAPGCFAGAIIVAWTTGASGDIGSPAVVTAVALLVGHVAAATASAMPATAVAPWRLALRWWQPTAVLAGSVVAAATAIAVLDAGTPPGSLLIVVAALAALTAGVWWWSETDNDT